MSTLAKQHSPTSAVFDGLVALQFPAITLAISKTNTFVASQLALPTAFKAYRIQALLTGTVAGTCSVNIVLGTGAEGSVGAADTVATAGAIALSSDTALTMSADSPQQISTSVPDCIYPSNGELTVRTVTNGSASGTLAITVLGKFYDTNPTKPVNSTFSVSDIP